MVSVYTWRKIINTKIILLLIFLISGVMLHAQNRQTVSKEDKVIKVLLNKKAIKRYKNTTLIRPVSGNGDIKILNKEKKALLDMKIKNNIPLGQCNYFSENEKEIITYWKRGIDIVISIEPSVSYQEEDVKLKKPRDNNYIIQKDNLRKLCLKIKIVNKLKEIVYIPNLFPIIKGYPYYIAFETKRKNKEKWENITPFCLGGTSSSVPVINNDLLEWRDFVIKIYPKTENCIIYKTPLVGKIESRGISPASNLLVNHEGILGLKDETIRMGYYSIQVYLKIDGRCILADEIFYGKSLLSFNEANGKTYIPYAISNIIFIGLVKDINSDIPKDDTQHQKAENILKELHVKGKNHIKRENLKDITKDKREFIFDYEGNLKGLVKTLSNLTKYDIVILNPVEIEETGIEYHSEKMTLLEILNDITNKYNINFEIRNTNSIQNKTKE